MTDINTLIANLRHGARNLQPAYIGGGEFSPREQRVLANMLDSLMAGFQVFVNMQKRGDGDVYPDMHKTDHRFYFTPDEAQKAIDADPDIAPYRHVVPIICRVDEAFMSQAEGEN